MNDDNEYIREHGVGDTPEPIVNEAEEAALDALIAQFGASYNQPPDIVPREEMWHSIHQATVQQRPPRKRPVWTLFAAAGLLLGVGIGIGTGVQSRVGPHATPVSPGTAQVAVTAPQPDVHAVGSVEPAGAESTPPREHNAITGNRGAYASNNGSDNAEVTGAARSQAYSLATVRHFTAVEALLTSYETTSHDARGDAQMAAWARALLSQTRLLLDSPAATDPARRKLLQDLELVLVQMTQISPADTPIDRDMIDGSVRHSDVITRLRTAVPAGGATRL